MLQLQCKKIINLLNSECDITNSRPGNRALLVPFFPPVRAGKGVDPHKTRQT